VRAGERGPSKEATVDDRSDEEIIEELAGRAGRDGAKLLAFLERLEAIDVDLDAERAALCLRERARYETMGRVLGEFGSPESLDPAELVPILEEAGAFDGFERDARRAAVLRGIRKLRQRRN
jgi:hypothetical protein